MSIKIGGTKKTRDRYHKDLLDTKGTDYRGGVTLTSKRRIPRV